MTNGNQCWIPDKMFDRNDMLRPCLDQFVEFLGTQRALNFWYVKGRHIDQKFFFEKSSYQFLENTIKIICTNFRNFGTPTRDFMCGLQSEHSGVFPCISAACCAHSSIYCTIYEYRTYICTVSELCSCNNSSVL
jgi:hypothetical protein